jgi:hypothetical protein
LADLERKPSAWQEGIHPEDRMEVLGRLRVAVREYDRSMDPIEYRVMRPDGSVRWVRHRAFGVRDGSTASHRIAGIITYITDEKEFLEESRRARAFSLRLLEAQEAERGTLSSELEPDAAGSGLCARVDNGTVRLGWNALSRPNRRRRWRPSAIGWWKLARAVLGRVAEVRPERVRARSLTLRRGGRSRIGSGGGLFTVPASHRGCQQDEARCPPTPVGLKRSTTGVSKENERSLRRTLDPRSSRSCAASCSRRSR